MKRQNGITLIALIITIIVLLILAGITIITLTGENGILNKSTKAAIETYHSTVKEQVILGVDQYFIDIKKGTYTDDVIKYLFEIGTTSSVGDYYRVNVGKVASTIKTGKGSTKEVGDIYVIEKYNTQTASIKKVASTQVSSLKIADISRIKWVLRYYETPEKYKDLLYLYGDGTLENPIDPSDPTKPADPTDPTIDPIVSPTDDDIKISYIEDLVELQQAVTSGDTKNGKRVILMNNLDFNSDSSYRDATANKEQLTGLGITSIGDKDNQFEGTFCGNGYTISNILINRNSGSNPAALFGYSNGTIERLIVDYSELPGSYTYRAGICVYNNGTITKCINKGNLSAPFVAGITLENNGNVTYCKNQGTITAQANQIGGIIGLNKSNSEIIGCVNEGTIPTQGANQVGGIVGLSSSAITIKDCKNSGSITSTSGTGGIIGTSNGNLSIENCTNTGEISCVAYNGGIVGEATNGKATIVNCHNNNNINVVGSSSTYSMGGIAGRFNGKIEGCTNKGTIDANNSATQLGGIVGETRGNNCEVTKCSNEGNIINVAEYTGGIVGKSGSAIKISGCYNKGQIIIDTAKSIVEIGGIIGEADNDGEIIFSYNEGAINTNGKGYDIGGIVGKIYGDLTISDVYNVANVSGGQYTGGIVGLCSSTNLYLTRSYNTGDISGTSYVGGIAGQGDGSTITNVYNTGGVTSIGGQYIGGISGQHITGSISNSCNIGNIGEGAASNCIGGIIGNNGGSGCSVENVFNAGNITGTNNVGLAYGQITSGASNTNVYYNNTLAGNEVGTYMMPPPESGLTTGTPEATMKSEAFISTLNTNIGDNDKWESWKLDATTGYPILDFTININLD